MEAIEGALDEHAVIILHDQHLSDDEQIAVSETGTTSIVPSSMRVPVKVRVSVRLPKSTVASACPAIG